MTIMDRGLDLMVPRETTPDEIATFRAMYRESHGGPLPAHDFWLDWDPEPLKRHRLQAYVADQSAHWFPLIFLHYYVITGYEDGIAYELINARHHGLSREAALETIATAFMHAGPFGLRFVASAAKGQLDKLADDGFTPELFPDGWLPDPEAFKSGLDFSDIELSAQERAQLFAWYERTIGEIPDYVTLLLRSNPRLLKAWRGRFENSVRDALPKQLMPALLLHLNISRGFAGGIREAVQLAKAFGVSRQHVLWIAGWGMLYGGTAGLSIMENAAGDVLDTFPD